MAETLESLESLSLPEPNKNKPKYERLKLSYIVRAFISIAVYMVIFIINYLKYENLI